jgi:hypothetical protein
MIWWPVVQQRLVALLPTLSGFTDWVVHDRAPVENVDARKYVIVGGIDPGAGEAPQVSAGTFEFIDEPIDGLRAERGEVICEFACWGGDLALPTYQANAFAYVEALDSAIRDDQSLAIGLTTTDLSVDVTHTQDSNGADQRLTVAVRYFGRSAART